jgi:hypothetical protein
MVNVHVHKVIDGEKDGVNYPIQPKDINIEDDCLWKAFKKPNDGACAIAIIRFAQKRGSWVPFSEEDIPVLARCDLGYYPLCTGIGDKNHSLCMGEDGKFRVTHMFIAECFMVSPAI